MFTPLRISLKNIKVRTEIVEDTVVKRKTQTFGKANQGKDLSESVSNLEVMPLTHPPPHPSKHYRRCLNSKTYLLTAVYNGSFAIQ